MDTKLIDSKNEETPMADGEWAQVKYDEVQIVLNQYIYMTLPKDLVEFYMDYRSLRWLVKMPEEKWSRMCIEKHFGGSNPNMLRWQYDCYVKDEVRFNKNWCFGILLKDDSIEGGYLLCALKAINKVDFIEFATFLIDRAKLLSSKKEEKVFELLKI